MIFRLIKFPFSIRKLKTTNENGENGENEF